MKIYGYTIIIIIEHVTRILYDFSNGTTIDFPDPIRYYENVREGRLLNVPVAQTPRSVLKMIVECSPQRNFQF